jgi:oligopeptide/dipeptide ABC transporter ATP-binding protein
VKALLEVQNLHTYFHTTDGLVRAVEGVDLTVMEGEALGVVGESGCGKSVTSLSIMRLIQPPGRIEQGSIKLAGRELLDVPDDEMPNIRGRDMAMIFQEPMTSLNPVFTVGDQISEAVLTHNRVAPAEARDRTVEVMAQVGIPDPKRRYDSYPHELSGGMRQRIMIAMALSCNPKLLIADEPTTALDATIQAQILELLNQLRRDFRLSLMLITHDLGVVAEMVDRVAVMYAGQVVETADVRTIFKAPQHPYTQGLLTSIPMLTSVKSKPLSVIPGTVPNPLNFPTGCRFHPRCPDASEITRTQEPQLRELGNGHSVRCWHHPEMAAGK